jgi:hypothetical protein
VDPWIAVMRWQCLYECTVHTNARIQHACKLWALEGEASGRGATHTGGSGSTPLSECSSTKRRRVALAETASTGGSDAENTYPLPDSRWWSTMCCEPAQNPPTDARPVPRLPAHIISFSLPSFYSKQRKHVHTSWLLKQLCRPSLRHKSCV